MMGLPLPMPRGHRHQCSHSRVTSHPTRRTTQLRTMLCVTCWASMGPHLSASMMNGFALIRSSCIGSPSHPGYLRGASMLPSSRVLCARKPIA